MTSSEESLQYGVAPEKVPFHSSHNGNGTNHTVNCWDEDFVFQMIDVTLEDDISENICNAWVHGVTENGDSVLVKYIKYKPNFYLSTNVENAHSWLDNLISELKLHKHLHNAVIVHKIPSVGFTNGETRPFVHFQFHTKKSARIIKNIIQAKFPPPTRDDILKGKYNNDVRLCEANGYEEMRFLDSLELTAGGWYMLKSSNYEDLPGITNAKYAFLAEEIHDHAQRQDVAVIEMDSIDIETVRNAMDGELPNAECVDDYIVSIAHTIFMSDGSGDKKQIVWSWIPTSKKICQLCTVMPALYTNKGTIPLFCEDCKQNSDIYIGALPNEAYCRLPDAVADKLDLKIMLCDSEEDMLCKWFHWWNGPSCSSTVVTGWNLDGYDARYIKTRMDMYKSLPASCKCWGRIKDMESMLITTQSESKSRSFKQISQPTMPGRVWMDALGLYKRDVTIKLTSYKLEAVAQHYFGTGKYPIHYSEIKDRFFGIDPLRFGELLYYNYMDTDLVRRLCLRAMLYQNLVHTSRSNRILCRLAAVKGQQLRVYSGVLFVAKQNGYVISRPHYHPLLDALQFQGGCMTSPKQKHDKNADAEVIDMIDRLFNMEIIAPATFGDKRHSSTYGTDKDDAPLESGNDLIISALPPIDHTPRRHNETRAWDNHDNLKNWVTTSGKKVDDILHVTSKKRKKSASGPNKKAFQGGFVQDPHRGIFENLIILDFNSLYPSIMDAYGLDPSQMVLDPLYDNCPGIRYLEIRINSVQTYRFALGKLRDGILYHKFKGPLVHHTTNLLAQRKVAQFIKQMNVDRLELERILLSTSLKRLNASWSAQECTHSYKHGELLTNLQQTLSNLDGNSNALLQEIHLDNNLTRKVTDIQNLNKLLPKDSWIQEATWKIDIAECIKKSSDKKIVEMCFSTQEYLNMCENETSAEILKVDLYAEFVFWHRKLSSNVANYNSKQNALKVGANSTFGAMGAGGIVLFGPDYDCNCFGSNCSHGKLRRYCNLCKDLVPCTHGPLKTSGMLSTMPVAGCITFLGRVCVQRAIRFIVRNDPNRDVRYADTDSTFVDCELKGIEGLAQSFTIGSQLAQQITSLFPAPIRMVHEKTAGKCFLLNPKCYALLFYETPASLGDIDIKGLQIAKRDCAPFVKQIGGEVIQIILRTGDVGKAVDYVIQECKKICNSNLTVEELVEKFVIYKRLAKKNYDAGTSSHKILADIIAKRDPHNAPQTGDTIAYCFVDVKDFDHQLKVYEKIDEVNYIIKNKLTIDIAWYLEKQLQTSIVLLFDKLIPNAHKILQECIGEQKRKQLGSNNILSTVHTIANTKNIPVNVNHSNHFKMLKLPTKPVERPSKKSSKVSVSVLDQLKRL